MSHFPVAKTDKREAKRIKNRQKPRGGTLGAMRSKLATTKGFKGTAKRMARLKK